MIRITLKGLAKFMTATPAQQRKILRDFKYPKEEGLAQAVYYKEARDFIYSKHKNNRPTSWLVDRAAQIQLLASAAAGNTKTRLGHNARALQEYAQHFGDRHFDVLGDLDVSLSIAGVRVKINPDLHVREGETEKLIKLEFSNKPPDQQVVRIICQTLYEGAQQGGRVFQPAAVLYLDVPRGEVYRGARTRSRLRGEIDAACQNIAALWDRI
jgi:hypothetical protein